MSRKLRKIKVISLFAGCGGSSLGYKMAGCEVMAAVEYDEHAVATYRANHPDTPVYDQDIAKLDPARLLAELGLQPGELDILDGSPPCQGFSLSGRRAIDDPRNRLFVEYVRFLQAMQPRAFVMENVAGLVQGRMKSTFREVIEALTGAGYTVRARVLNAAHYGVPQSRPRVIILGIRSDLNRIPEHPRAFTTPQTFREAVRNLVPSDTVVLPKGKAYKIALAIRPGESGRDLHDRYKQKKNDFSLKRLSWDKPAPTVCKSVRPGQCGLLHPVEDRFLTIGELKRICSFPDDYILTGSFEQQWARLGNAVPPLLMKAIAESLTLQIQR